MTLYLESGCDLVLSARRAAARCHLSISYNLRDGWAKLRGYIANSLIKRMDDFAAHRRHRRSLLLERRYGIQRAGGAPPKDR